MLVAKNFITYEYFLSSKSNGVKVFLYNEIDININISEKSELIFLNCTQFRIESTWFTWRKNEEIFENFKKKYPKFFLWNNYDFSLAFIKALYWSNQKTGFLQYVKENNFSKESVWKEDGLFDSKFLNVFVKYYHSFFKHRIQSEGVTTTKKNGKIGFLLKNEFQVTLYKYLIKQSLNNHNILFFVMDNSVKEAVVKIGAKPSQIIFCNKTIKRKMPFINCLFLDKPERFVLNQIVNNWEEVQKWTAVAEQMADYGISKVLINEAENGVFGAVLGEVFNKLGVVSYNTMNGMKAGQAQDKFINFDYWFIWDEKLKQLLMQKNELPDGKLIVSGHLMEDEVRDYQYQNSLPLSMVEMKGKKVVSLFSVRGKRQEKMEAFDYIYKQAGQNENLIILIRQHPSEKDEDAIRPPKALNNVYMINYTQENSKKTLYDQLRVSHLSICFGSTVALESKWFGVPCMTFEKREESLIYAVDNEIIFHARDGQSFNNLFLNLMNVDTEKSFLANTCFQTGNNIMNELIK